MEPVEPLEEPVELAEPSPELELPTLHLQEGPTAQEPSSLRGHLPMEPAPRPELRDPTSRVTNLTMPRRNEQ